MSNLINHLLGSYPNLNIPQNLLDSGIHTQGHPQDFYAAQQMLPLHPLYQNMPNSNLAKRHSPYELPNSVEKRTKLDHRQQQQTLETLFPHSFNTSHNIENLLPMNAYGQRQPQRNEQELINRGFIQENMLRANQELAYLNNPYGQVVQVQQEGGLPMNMSLSEYYERMNASHLRRNMEEAAMINNALYGGQGQAMQLKDLQQMQAFGQPVMMNMQNQMGMMADPMSLNHMMNFQRPQEVQFINPAALYANGLQNLDQNQLQQVLQQAIHQENQARQEFAMPLTQESLMQQALAQQNPSLMQLQNNFSEAAINFQRDLINKNALMQDQARAMEAMREVKHPLFEKEDNIMTHSMPRKPQEIINIHKPMNLQELDAQSFNKQLMQQHAARTESEGVLASSKKSTVSSSRRPSQGVGFNNKNSTINSNPGSNSTSASASNNNINNSSNIILNRETIAVEPKVADSQRKPLILETPPLQAPKEMKSIPKMSEEPLTMKDTIIRIKLPSPVPSKEVTEDSVEEKESLFSVKDLQAVSEDNSDSPTVSERANTTAYRKTTDNSIQAQNAKKRDRRNLIQTPAFQPKEMHSRSQQRRKNRWQVAQEEKIKEESIHRMKDFDESRPDDYVQRIVNTPVGERYQTKLPEFTLEEEEMLLRKPTLKWTPEVAQTMDLNKLVSSLQETLKMYVDDEKAIRLLSENGSGSQQVLQLVQGNLRKFGQYFALKERKTKLLS